MTRVGGHESKGPPPPLTDRVDEGCDRFEAAWVAGVRPRIEDYLPETAGPERESYLRELLILELAYRRRNGEHPICGEYASRFPEYRTAVAALFGKLGDRGAEREQTDRAKVAPTTGEATAAGPPRLTLEVIEGAHTGRAFSFEEHDSFIVGRSPQAHFQLPKKDSHFSRIHFLIEFNPPHCRLMDMQSTNGTLVNGKRVARADLKDGDRIQGGRRPSESRSNRWATRGPGFPRPSPTGHADRRRRDGHDCAGFRRAGHGAEDRPSNQETVRRPLVGSAHRGRDVLSVLQGLWHHQLGGWEDIAGR